MFLESDNFIIDKLKIKTFILFCKKYIININNYNKYG